jgi:hypothetical protein
MITLAEGEISELHVGLKGTTNALFLKDLGKKTWRGLEGRVRQGRSGGGLCYGYNVVRELDGAGELLHGGRTMNEAEAAIIRRILNDYGTGKSPRMIARDLNLEGWEALAVDPGATRRYHALPSHPPEERCLPKAEVVSSNLAGCVIKTARHSNALARINLLRRPQPFGTKWASMDSIGRGFLNDSCTFRSGGCPRSAIFIVGDNRI